MGKGDRRTAKGKRYCSSYGNIRPHRTGAVPAAATPVAAPVKAPAARKTAAKKKA
ncbi:MAG: 30S ribosomal protein THX [Xanthomonadales bacterium]|nr:30S ribosomal protein THX [Xanthomonadales bacterium]